jgi:hypothetical protein
MTKRQLFLIAGALTLAACSPQSFNGPDCQVNEDTQETICLTRPERATDAPGLSVDTDEPQ